MHRHALLGRNYGRSGVGDSGEEHALRYATTSMVMAPVVIDVGACEGDWTVAALKQWPGAVVHAFEPAPTSYDRLVERLGDRARCVQAACGEQQGSATLFSVPGQPGLTSLHNRDLSGHGLAMTETVEVAVTTLAHYCQQQQIERIDYLKVDAEGHDLAVLRGAGDLLGEVRFLQFEFGGANLDSRTFLRDFVDLLTPTHRLYRMLSDGLEPLAYSEAEEIFVTANFFAVQR